MAYPSSNEINILTSENFFFFFLCVHLDTMGTAFSMVKSDLAGNINKIRTRHDAAPAVSGTLQELVNAERADKQSTATDGLLWLKRGLDFTAQGLRRNVQDPTEELSKSFNKAYENTLYKYHSFMVRPVFSLAMKACPYRKDFYEKLGKGSVSWNDEAMELWLAALERVVAILNAFYTSLGFK